MSKSLSSFLVRLLVCGVLTVVCLGLISQASFAAGPLVVQGPANGPKIWLRASQTLSVSHVGPAAPSMAGAQPLSMVSADFDNDGVPDLVAGYSTPSGGVVVFHRGNLDAFAPQSEASFQAIGRGEFPSPFLPEARAFPVPVHPDLMATGAFLGSGNQDLAIAAKGGSVLYVLPNDGKGNFGAPQTVSLPGGVTALAAGQLGKAHSSSLVVGVSAGKNFSLAVYASTPQGITATANYAVGDPVSNILFGDFGDPNDDIAFLSGDNIQILRSSTLQLTTVALGVSVRAFTLGSFVSDRNSGSQIAVLAADGSIHIAARSEFDPRAYTLEELKSIRQARWNNQPVPWVPDRSFPSNGWQIVESFAPVGSIAPGQAPVFFRARISNHGSDDVMWLNAGSRHMAVISHPDLRPGIQTFLPGQVSIKPYAGSPVAALSARVNVDGRPGVIALHWGQSAPAISNPIPDPTFFVNRTDDPTPTSPIANACNNTSPTDKSSSCSLREAVLKANGDTIMLQAGTTYSLTIGRPVTQDYSGNTGALYVNNSVTIVGGDKNTTVIQWGTPGSGTVDMVMAVNQDVAAFTNASASLSNLTIQNGTNNGAQGVDGDGGCMEFDTGGTNAATATATLTLTNVTLQNCATTQGNGGGLATFNTNGGTGMATVSNSIIQGNSVVQGTGAATGGGISVADPSRILLSNSQVLNNHATQVNGGVAGDGGGITITSNTSNSNQTVIHGSTISGNQAAGEGGGVKTLANTLIDQGSVISNNSAGSAAIANDEDGGGIFMNPSANGCPSACTDSVVLNKVTITGNSAPHGGGIATGTGSPGGPLIMSFSRLAGNSASTSGSNLENFDSTVTATNNWWGTNNPGSTIHTDAGATTFDPFIVLTHTAAPATISPNGTSTLTGDMSHDNHGNGAALAGNLDVLNGLPITFGNAILGAITPAQPESLNASGTATATYTAGATPGAGSADATVDSATVTVQITVTTVTHFAISAPATATAGSAFNFTVTAQDASNATVTSYTGTVHFTSSDGAATLPADSTLTNGVGTFSASLKTAGNQTISAADTGDGTRNGTSNTIAVSAAAATHFSVSAPASATAGAAFNFTVTALDQFNNTATGYADPVHFTSTDGAATLPADSTLTNGTGTFSATLKTAGSQTITATDPLNLSITGTSNTIAVGAAAATHFALSTPVSATAGTAFNFTVTAQDQFNNTATGYAGTVHFTSTDGAATLPADSTLTNGTGTFSATLKTVGSQTITATDTVTLSITGTSNSITVTSAPPQPPLIAKSFLPTGIQPNGVSTMIITITNPQANTVPLAGVAFNDFFPANLVVATPNGLSNTCGGTVVATAGTGTVSLTGGSIPVNSSCTVTANVTTSFTGSYTNSTGPVSSTNGGTGGSASATLSVAFPPTISKQFVPDTIFQGRSALVSFTIQNPNSNSTPPNNDMTLTGIQFTDNLPAGLVVASANQLSNDCGGTVTAVPGSSSIALTGGSLAPAAPLVPKRSKGSAVPALPLIATGACFISVSVTPSTVGAFTNITGPISANESGPGATSNTATLTVAAPPPPPTLTKAFGAASILLTGTTTLTFTVANPPANTVSFGHISFSDPLPAGLVVASPNGLGGTCPATLVANPGSNTITVTNAVTGTVLDPAASCTIVVNVTGTTRGTKNNMTSNVAATFDDGTGTLIPVTGNPGAASMDVVAANLAITKTHSGSFAQRQVGAVYTITVGNVGNAPTLGTVTVTDTLPPSLSATGLTGTGWTCDVPSVTCTRSDSLAINGAYPPITLTVNVAANAPASVTNTATASGGGDPNSQVANDPTTVTVTGAPIVITPDPNSNTVVVAAGMAANFTFTVDAGQINPPAQVITFTCSGLPKGTACIFSPLGEAQPVTQVTMTITTLGRNNSSAILPFGGDRTPIYAVLLPVLSLVGISLAGRRGRKTRLRLAAAFIGLMFFLALWGCGGNPLVTPPGTYPIIVTGTASTPSGNVSGSATVNLKVL